MYTIAMLGFPARVPFADAMEGRTLETHGDVRSR